MRALFAILLAFSCGHMLALPITVDPTGAPFTGSWGTEWNTVGNFESWALTQATGAVAGGILQGTATGTDSNLRRTSISGGPDLDLGWNDYVELRVQVPAGYAGPIQISYGTTGPASGTGFSAARVLTIPGAVIPKDGAFHIYRIDVGLEVFWRGTLTDLRIDPVDGAGTGGMAFAIDYIRIGDQPGATVYQQRITTEAPADGTTHINQGPSSTYAGTTRTVHVQESKHFRFLWDDAAPLEYSTFWTSTMPHNTLRNLEECWQTHVNMLGYREPSASVENPNSVTKYKVNVTSWYGGYWAGGDPSDASGTYWRLNITPDGLRENPPTWIIPHEFAHVLQGHNTTGYVPGEWFETHANYCRERWIQYYQAFFPNQSGIDPTFLRCAHQIIAEGRDYYLSWPFFMYLDQNPDGLPDLGEGTMVKLWQQTQSSEYSMMTLERLTPSSSLKNIVGSFARRGANYNYPSQTAIQASLASFGVPLDNAATARWQFTDLVQRSDDPTWWRVPFEMAPMQGAYAIHELVVSGSGTPGRTVTVNLHGLPDTARGADWRACFIVVADNGTERYSSLWSSGTNSVTLSGTENKLYLSVAGAPNVFYQGGQDETPYPYRSYPSKTRFPYELQVTGAAPKQRDNGLTTGLVQHSNGGGYKANTATVAATAYIGTNARVLGAANVSGNAQILDYAVVQDTAQVSGNAVVSGHAWVRGNAVVTDQAKVRDWALVESGTISTNARVLEHANIKGGLVTDVATAKGCAASLTGTLSGNAMIDGDYGDYFYGRDVSNGIAFGHLPYSGVPDSWIHALPAGLYASYDFATAHDSRILDQYGVTDGFCIGSPAWIAADAKRKGFLTFDGSSQYVNLDRSVADLHDFTFTAWVKPLGGAANQAVVWLGATTTRRLCFTPDDGTGHAKFSINNGGIDQVLTASSALTPGVWTHVAVTLDGTNGVLYLNGTSAATGSINLRPDQLLAPNTASGLQQNYLARPAGTLMPMFRGALDEVQFYGKALPATDIAALQPPITPASNGTLYVNLRASDATAGTANWVNSGGLSGTFTLTGSSSKVANVLSTGIPGVWFDGTSAYTGPNSVADIDGQGNRTIEVWAFNPTLGDEETMVSGGHRGGVDRNLAFSFGSNPNWGAASHYGDDLGWGTAPPSAGAWHHLAYTYDGSTTATVYIDGNLTNSRTLNGTLNTFAGEPLNIACQRDSANGTRSYFFIGYINTVRIHGGVLTAAQIAANYSFGPAGAPGNVAPALAAISDQTIDFGTTPVSIPLTLSDADTALNSLTITGFGANATLVPAANIVFSGTGSTRNAIITPTGTGTTAMTFTVSDGVATASRTFNLTLLNQVETWRRQKFGTTANTGNAADAADPDNDGIQNLLERAFGGDPNSPSPNILPVVDPTGPLLSITYYKSKAATDLSIAVLESSDLSPNSWIPSTGTTALLSDDGTRQHLSFTTLPGSLPRKFLRLQVTSH